jgi:hypothetical protein
MYSVFPQTLETTIKLQPLISELSKNPNNLATGRLLGFFYLK